MYKTERRMALIALIALSFIAFLGKAYENSLRGIDSNIHAAVAMNVTSSGFMPRLPIPYVTGDPHGGVFNDHPFFGFWINGWVMRHLGPNAWSARLVSASFSVGCVLLVYLYGSLLNSPLLGFVSALFFLFCRDVILTGATFTLDMPMLFFILLTFLLWEKKKPYATGVAAGVGLWFKTPVVLLIYPSAFIISCLHRQMIKSLPRLLASFLIALGIGSLVWVLLGVQGGWHWVADYWGRQVLGSAVYGRPGTGTNYGLFFQFVRQGFIPGLPFLIWGIFKIAIHKRWRVPIVERSWVGLGVLVLCISALTFKYDYYFNPAFPFLSWIAAYGILEGIKPFEKKIYLGVSTITPLLAAFLLCTPTSLGPEAFVALKRFEPLIQSYGRCDDTVLYVPGGEPFGSMADYRAHLVFYTRRRMQAISCKDLGEMAQSPEVDRKIGWLMISKDNLSRCLNQKDQKLFSQRFRVGNQYLLTNRIPKSDFIDLTPLDKEYQAIRDCQY